MLRTSLVAIQLFLALAIQFTSAFAKSPTPRTPRSRMHLADIALNLTSHANPINDYYYKYYEYFHQPKIKLTKVPSRSRRPSPFEKLLEQTWKPEEIDVVDVGMLTRKKKLPAVAPWLESVTNELQFSELENFKGAFISAIGRFADENGFIDVDQLATQFDVENPLEHSLYEMLVHPAARSTRGMTWNHVYAYLDRDAAQKVGMKYRDTLIPKDMKALPWVNKKYNTAERLSGIQRVWAKQHILGNTAGFLDSLGIDPKKFEIWGKVYSLDPRAASIMDRQGYRLHGNAVSKDRRLIEAQVREQLKAIKHPEQYKKPIFLILDDGGEMIEVIANYVRRAFPAYAHLFAAVEQTQGGVNRIKKLDVPFLVITNGDSWAKQNYGSPMFGYAVAKEVAHVVESYKQTLTRRFGTLPRRVTVLGYGNIGRYVAKTLAALGFEVMVYDRDPTKRRLAAQEGHRVSSRKARALQHADYLVSCVGQKSFRQRSFWQLRDGVIVINAASVNEFERVGEPRGLPKFTSDSYQRAPQLIWRNFVKPASDEEGDLFVRNLGFVKDGGVINFPLEVDHPRSGNLIPGRYIQLELGQLTLALAEAAEGGAPTLRKPDEVAQRELVDYVEKQLARTGESLLDPKWE